MSITPIPFYILCGSLGAGKTTLLMRLLEHWKTQGQRAGVLMNEAGSVSIDGPRAGTLAEQVMNLAGGCVCCDTKEDLSWGIAQLVRDYASDVLILECSGLADPAEVIDAVTDAYTARLASLERVIALVHPVSTEESHSGAYVTTQAIRCADELILNKRDLYVPGHWEGFRAGIVAQNPYARLWETSHARLDAADLLAPHGSTKHVAPTNVLFNKSKSSALNERPTTRLRRPSRYQDHSIANAFWRGSRPSPRNSNGPKAISDLQKNRNCRSFNMRYRDRLRSPAHAAG